MSINLDSSEDQGFRNRTSLILGLAIGVILLGLVGRLYYLQILRGEYHAQLSDRNSMRPKILKAPRGFILASGGEVLVRNRPSYQIALMPMEIRNADSLFENLMKFSDSTGKNLFDSSLVTWSIARGRWRRFQPLVILEDADPAVVAMIEEHQLDLPGVVTLAESRRWYPYGTLAAHAMGYMDEITEEELNELEKAAGPNKDSLLYARGDRVGRKGLEKVYEPYFRGRDGLQYVRVNAMGKEIEVLEDMPQVEPVSGNSLVTSIDLELQQVAEEAISDTVKGAVVAIDPRDGSIMVMMSSPRLDPNTFSLSKDRRKVEWAKLALNSRMPLNNRATVGGYDPASTYKILVSLAAMRSGKVEPKEHMPQPCHGSYRFGTRAWKCWKPSGHGSTDFYSALMQSCDVYYYQVGLRIGLESMNKAGHEFGFGQKTGVDLDAERRGELVDSSSFTKKFKARGWHWSRGMILNLSIGQGEVATPLQLANMAAGLGNGKYLYRPHLIKEIHAPDGTVIKRAKPEVLHTINISKELHEILLKGLEDVITTPGGTGGRAAVPGIRVGGKTGSAENPHGDVTNALFIAVAPLENPEIAIAVVLENVGHGGSMAAPVAGAILRRYFERKASGNQQKKI